MEKIDYNYLKYPVISLRDDDWGITITTVGQQFILPKACYPARKHPDRYNFKPGAGRVLDEYQLVYITEGEGYFESASVKRRKVKAGTMIMLFPGERHNYAPDKETGWNEYWIGFKGEHIDNRVRKRFFNKTEPLYTIGLDSKIVSLYLECIALTDQEQIGYQQIVSSIMLHLLGIVYYKHKNHLIQNSHNEQVINKACILMRERISYGVRAEDIAKELGISYSTFRHLFKQMTSITPAQFQTQLLVSRAKELLSMKENSVSDVAFELGFETVGRFSVFFRKQEGITPTQFREMTFF